MHRSTVILTAIMAALVAACEPAPLTAAAVESTAEPLSVVITRDHITGDVYHCGFLVRVGSSPNAQLQIHRVVRERAPFFPRPSTAAAMFMHGDFAGGERGPGGLRVQLRPGAVAAVHDDDGGSGGLRVIRRRSVGCRCGRIAVRFDRVDASAYDRRASRVL